MDSDDALLQTKSELRKEYFYLKKQIQLEQEDKGDANSNLIGNCIYDLVDKQHLLIQELAGKYNELKAKFTMKKMIIASKANVLKEVHLNVLNRLLERNYHQENRLIDLTTELNQLKKQEEKEKPKEKPKKTKSIKQLALIPIMDTEGSMLFTERKNRAINVYNYNAKNKVSSVNLTLNTTAATSTSNMINSSTSRVLIKDSSTKPMRITNLRIKLNSVPKPCLKKKIAKGTK